MTRPPRDFAASARARLLDLTRRSGQDFQLTLQRYVAERFLYRLGASLHRDGFVLKGAMLFALWAEMAVRPTRDLDLAGYGTHDASSLAAAFREICAMPSPQDGLQFALDTVQIATIGAAAGDRGFRLHVDVRLAGALIPFQVDVGFGDAIVPEPREVTYPTLLDGDAPRIRAYPREAVVAEKLHAMVAHGSSNTRYKDFFDVDVLATRFGFEGAALTAAIAATFSRRGSAQLSPWPVALSASFYADASRSEQWRRYLERSRLADAPADFGILGERAIAFLELPARAASEGAALRLSWVPGGPWR